MDRDDWNERYAAAELVWTDQANRFLTEEADDLPPGRALDLACGECRNAVWLAEHGWDVRAVDFSDVAIEKGRRLAAGRGVADRIDFRVADLSDHVPETGAYDLVVLLYLHLPQEALAPIIARAAGAVAPDGTFLLVGHDVTNLTRGHGGPQTSAVLYTADQVVRMLGPGFEIEKAGAVERPVETDEGPKTAIDCLVRARRSSTEEPR